jgi:hypothetical protein
MFLRNVGKHLPDYTKPRPEARKFIVTPVRTSKLKLFSFVDNKRDSILSIPSLKTLCVCVCVRARSGCEIRIEGGSLLAHWIISARLVTPAPLASVNYETLGLSETHAYVYTYTHRQ